MADIFISYSREDRTTARKLHAVLRERGWSVWWDPLTAPGDSWTPTIERELRAARCVIVLWSKASIHKHWLGVQGAKAARRRILISAVIDDVVPPFVFPAVRPLPLTDAAGELTFIGLQRLFADIGRKLGLPRQPLPQSVASASQSASAVDGSGLWARLKDYPPGRRLLGHLDQLRSLGGALTPGDVKSAQAELIESLLNDKHPAPEVQRLLTRINNEMYRSIGDSVCAQMVFDGWGDLPAPMTIMVMGSGGRGENYLLSDQDNGFIIGAYPDSEHLRIDAYFRQLAEQMCHRLNDAGLPYCSGYCMATNPLWRKTLPQWFDQIALWVRKSNFIALRLADIFFDFQPVWGDPVLAGELRALVTQRARSDPLFLRQMFREIKTSKVALGVFGSIATEKDERLDQGKVHLKYSGIVPMVEAIRLLALRDGVEETSTLERIRVLNERGGLGDDESDDLSGAFHVITDLVLRKEARDFRAGLRLSYDFYPDAMSGRERLLLVDSLRAIRRLRRRLRHELLEEAL